LTTKCPHCGSEWHTTDKIIQFITKCPFCSKRLGAVKAKDEPPKDMGSVIKGIIEKKGPGSLVDKAFAALVSDMGVAFEKECHWIKSAIADIGIGKMFYDAFKTGRVADIASVQNVAYNQLVKDGITEERASYVVHCFAYGLGWDDKINVAEDSQSVPTIEAPAPGPSAKKKTSVTKKLKTTIFYDVARTWAKIKYITDDDEMSLEKDLSKTLANAWKQMIKGVNSRGFKSTGLGVKEVSWIFDEMQAVFEDGAPGFDLGRIAEFLKDAAKSKEPFALFIYAIADMIFCYDDYYEFPNNGVEDFKQDILRLKQSEDFEESKLILDLLEILGIKDFHDFRDFVDSAEDEFNGINSEFFLEYSVVLIKCLTRLVDQGFADMQLVIGILYLLLACDSWSNGKEPIVAGFCNEGLRVLKLAANNGFDLAQFALANHYEWEVFDPKSEEEPNELEITRWYLLAANRGLEAAQYEAAKRYEEGKGVNADAETAKCWESLANVNSSPETELLTDIIYDILYHYNFNTGDDSDKK
jgi:hypothetical protein